MTLVRMVGITACNQCPHLYVSGSGKTVYCLITKQRLKNPDEQYTGVMSRCKLPVSQQPEIK